MKEYLKFGISEKRWNDFSEKEKNFHRNIGFKPAEVASGTVHFRELKSRFDKYKEDAEWSGGAFELSPDFQRGNKIWSKKQKIQYIENLIRGLAPVEFRFNSDNWLNKYDGKKENIVCIDGLQRISAILDFMEKKISVFEGVSYEDLKKYGYPIGNLNVIIKMYAIESRADLLQYYIMLNAGGTAHSKKEIAKVSEMLSNELKK